MSTAEMFKKYRRVKKILSTPRETYADEIKTAASCTRSSKASMSNSISQSSAAAAKMTFDEVILRLENLHLRTFRMTQERFSRLLPRNATPKQLAIWNALITQPLLVTPEDLGSIMELEESTARSPPTSADEHHFYVRSWTLTVKKVTETVEDMVKNGKSREEFEHWRKAMSDSRLEKEALLTIRYIGKTDGPNRPFDRFRDDLLQRGSGILPEFVKYLEENIPAVFEAAQVWLIKQASLPFISQMNSDDVERFLIGLFHLPTLLNRRPGGDCATYVSTSANEMLFRGVNTDFYHQFMANCRSCSMEVTGKIVGHFEEYASWANSNPTDTGTSAHPFTPRLCKIITKQATPRQICGYTLMVFIGRDITYEDYLTEKPFIDGVSRAAHLYREFMCRLARNEAEAHGRYWDDRGFVLEDFFAFVDLWPTLWHRCAREAFARLQAYLSVVRPLIAVSYSVPINQLVRADFEHQDLYMGARITPIIGVPIIQHYAAKSGGSHEDDAFINLAQHDPGMDKYTSHIPQLRRLFDLANQVTFLIGSIGIGVLTKLGIESPKSPKRLEICQMILRDFEVVKATPGGDKLFAALDQAKLDVCQVWGNSIKDLGQ